ncbi:TPA: hypothetical protein RTG57_001746 [Campylobacter jejuni]|nr:hypothetical protein [Campylobacter jejuni]
MNYIKNIEEFNSIFKSLSLDKPIFFDTETIGLYGRTRLIQLRQDSISMILDCYYINIEEIKFSLKNSHLVGHNIHYDLSCQDFRRWLPRKIDDTMILSKAMWPTLESHSLKSLSSYLNLSEKTDEGKSDWSTYNLTSDQLIYADIDTLLVEEIYKRIDKSIMKSTYYKLDIKNIMLSLVYQNKGMPLCHKNIAKFKKEMIKGIESSTLPKELNINSPVQVKKFLNTESSSKETLAALNTPEAIEILNQRHYSKALSYLEDFKNYNFLYSFINPAGAKTGRFTSKGGDVFKDYDYVNLQQIPRKLKSIFKVNKPSLFVTADYPALEVWMCGAIIADEFLVNVLKQKEDLHYSAAEKMFNKNRSEITKDERMIAKMCNFTLMYGAGFNTLAEAFVTNGFSEVSSNARQFREDWLKTYKQINEEQQKVFKHFKTNKYMLVYTALGRPMCAFKPTEALNFSIQGSGAECTKLALTFLDKNGIIPVNTVHDSIALIASSEKEAEEYAECLKYSMEEAYRRVIKNCKANDLSLEVSVNIGEEYE